MAGGAVAGNRHVTTMLDHLERLLVRVLRVHRRSANQEQRESEEDPH
jgi:hypothetical protein